MPIPSGAHLPQNAGLGHVYSGEPGSGFITEPGLCLGCASGLSRSAVKSYELSDIPLGLDLNVLKSSKGQDLGDSVHG